MDENEPRIVTEKHEKQEPKTVMEKKTVEVPKTVMEQRTIEEPRQVMETRVYERLISASCKELDGYEVVNPQGEKLGTFEDVMLDLQSGRIAYAVISISSGFMGMGSKKVAVPWDALSIEGAEEYSEETATHRIVLNLSKEQLENAKSFDKGEWPRNPDREWLNENLYRGYGYKPWWTEHYEQ